MSKRRGTFEIRIREKHIGKNGGLGPVKSFRATLSKGTLSEAQQKVRGDAVVISVRKAI